MHALVANDFPAPCAPSVHPIHLPPLSLSLTASPPSTRLIPCLFCADNKIWEAVAEAQLEADEILANMADVVYFTSAEAHGEEPPVEAPKVETKA